MIYISNDLSQGWDGRSNDGNRIIEGTYAYNIIIDDVNDKRFVYNGMIRTSCIQRMSHVKPELDQH